MNKGLWFLPIRLSSSSEFISSMSFYFYYRASDCILKSEFILLNKGEITLMYISFLILLCCMDIKHSKNFYFDNVVGNPFSVSLVHYLRR